MLIVRKRGTEIRRDRNDLVVAQTTMDGVYLKFADDTEVNIKMIVSKEVQAMLPAIVNSTAEKIEIDLENPRQPVSFESHAKPKIPITPVESKKENVKPENIKTPTQ